MRAARILNMIALLSASVAVACGGGPSPAVSPGLQQADEPLLPGDMIRVAFSEERNLNGEFPVDETSSASLPLLGRVSVTGLGGAALRDSLITAYEGQLRNQTVQVGILRRVRVLGEVNSPGLYHIDPTMTLVDAIALAGGPTTTGKLDGVDVWRDGRVIAEDLPETNLVGNFVRSGDQIIVPRTSWLSRNATWVIGGTISTAAIVITTIITSD